jgi:hypothetical protein
MFHTVYDSFESHPGGRDYIGKHSTDNPYDDYLGSFKDKSFNPEDKIVFAYSKTKEGAVWLEIMFQRVFGVVEDPQFANKSYQTSDKFVTGFAGEDHPMYGAKRPDVTERNLTNNPSKQPEAAAKIAEAARKRKGTDTEETRRKKGKTLRDRIADNPNHQSEMGSKGGAKTRELGVGIFDPANKGKGSRARSPENKRANGLKTSSILNSQKWQNTDPNFPPYVSTPAGLSAWQKARGIDKSNRVQLV